MNYKELFKIALLLISSPAKAWEEIRVEKDRQKVFNAFVYPMIGLCALSVFLGVLFTNGWSGPQSFQIAMRDCCVVAVALFGGFFLSAFVLNKMGVRLFKLPNNIALARQFSGYALVVTFLIQIVTGLLPEFQLVALVLQFYVVYVVWEGVPILIGINDDSRVKYTLFASLILIVCPAIIQIAFNRLLILFS